jgi:hypothetical protein
MPLQLKKVGWGGSAVLGSPQVEQLPFKRQRDPTELDNVGFRASTQPTQNLGFSLEFWAIQRADGDGYKL